MDDAAGRPSLEERLARLRLGMSSDQVASILYSDKPIESTHREAGRPREYLHIATLEIPERVPLTIQLRYLCGGLTSWRIEGDWVDVPHVPGTCKRCGWPLSEPAAGTGRPVSDRPDSGCSFGDEAEQKIYEAYVRARRRLRETSLESVNIVDIPFERAVETIRENSLLSVDVAWEELERAGFDRNTEVTLRFRQVGLIEYIDALLAVVARHGVVAGYDVVGDKLVLSTREDLLRRIPVCTRTYYVGDLIERTHAVGSADQLAELVRGFVLPDTWKRVGGTIGTLAHDHDKLIVAHVPAAHFGIDELLAQLRVQRCPNCLGEIQNR